MWNDPAWAFGIAFIILAISVRKALPRLLRSIAERQSDRGPLEAHSAASEEALEELRGRVSELEERVDFAERLLSKQRDLERLAPPET
jgi:hypothetical protein